MVLDSLVEGKEALAWLIMVSRASNKALQNLKMGNPYDAIRLIKIISKFNVNILNVLIHVPNYDSRLKIYHLELIRECNAILILSREALDEVSHELGKMPAERLAAAKQVFNVALEHLGMELEAERKLEHWISEAKEAFIGQEKAWTYSRAYMERALEVLKSLVEDEQKVKQTYERFGKIFRGVKHPDPNKFVRDLLINRRTIMVVIEFILKNAFKSLMAFQGHNWLSELNKIADLPGKDIRDLEQLQAQLASAAAFTKGNIDYSKVRQLLERLAGISVHASVVERAMESEDVSVVERAKTEEEFLREYWGKHVHGGFVYHGTSSIFLENIKRLGLNSEGIGSESSPFNPGDYKFFIEVLRKAYGNDAPFIRYFTQDVTQGFFLDANYNSAGDYARQGSERIRFMLEHIRSLENEFRMGLFAGRVSHEEVKKLLEISRKYKEIMALRRPIVLHISLSSPALLAVLSQNGQQGALAAKMIANFGVFRKYVLKEFGSAKSASGLSDFKLVAYLEKFNPLERFFHNKPFQGIIPFAGISKVEAV